MRRTWTALVSGTYGKGRQVSRIAGDRIYLDSDGLLGPPPRYIIWFHGCNRNCPGCIAVDWNRKKSPAFELSVRTVVETIHLAENIEGVTISGGEPFFQLDALYELVMELHRSNFGIIIYSGYELSELKKMQNPKINSILKIIDVLIDGTYKEKLDDNLPYRGSSNQNIYQFTKRYREFFTSKKRRNSSIEKKDGQALLTGIPSKEVKQRWLEMKNRNGYKI